MGGRISFVGAGPGAADLITLRGARRIAEADVVVWPANLVDQECVRQHASPTAQLVDASLASQAEVVEVYRRAAVRGLNVVRLLAGDPALWSGVREQFDACAKLGLATEIVPGVSGFSAAAAAVGRELTLPEVTQSVVLTRLSGGPSPVGERERIRELASHGSTMAVVLSAARIGQLAEELRAGGYPEDTPVVVASKTTRPDEVVLHTTLAELEATVKQHKLWRHTLVLVGAVLRGGATRSRRYGSGQTPAFRKARPGEDRPVRRSYPGGAAGATDVPGATEPTSGTRRAQPTQWSLRAGRRAARRANPPQTGGAVQSAGSVGSAGEPSRVDRTRLGRTGAAGPDAVYWATRSGGAPAQGGDSTPDTTGAAGEGNPASAAAWSAVRGWQETARANGRAKGRGRTSAGSRAKAGGAGEQQVLALPSRPADPAPADEATRPTSRRNKVVAAATRRTSVAVSAGAATAPAGEQPARPASTPAQRSIQDSPDRRVGAGTTPDGADVTADAAGPVVPTQHAAADAIGSPRPASGTSPDRTVTDRIATDRAVTDRAERLPVTQAPARSVAPRPRAEAHPAPPAAAPAEATDTAGPAGPAASPTSPPEPQASPAEPQASPAEPPTAPAEPAKPAATRSGGRSTAARAKAATRGRAKPATSTRAKRGKTDTD
ncbi:SAM-dependent methyltransferase [Goodfellowiella coeruleoviolacea]|uniref:Precorrin-4/cobalt-precorrin-4 C11-methyltransferase n=1 Tax=Goodfellowiella coeruleoviolacea TaxID=334858 RepID=A0AAE3GJX6_9PSEU|nr:SAM-dependent methyltransferase [Goodfellowiella coeruleoviolacea]MCP2169637.1 precorrin-4/cobalt-precorrin-4 C11-methyltransferase [Goodfellowiella coeruleoviolacea]